MSIMGMGWMELAIIAIGGLLIFGPDRLPEVAGQVGKFVRDIRKMTGELSGELERTAGVSDIKKAVQSELAGVKSTVDSATKGVSSSVSSAKSTVNKATTSAVTAAKGTTTAAKSSTTATGATKSSSSATKKAAPAPKPVASKKDPLADVSFFGEPTEEPKLSATTTATLPKATAVAATESNGRSTIPGAVVAPDQSDALGRARQRRLAAGYNRRTS